MNRSVFLGIAAGFLLCISSVSAHGQILLNEIDVNPGGGDNGCEYIELIGPPGAAVENLHFVSLEGDTNKGQATAVISFGVPGPVIGSNGLLVVVSAAGCAPRTYAAGTTVITTSFLDNPTGVLQNGSNSFVLISSTTAIAPNADLDANDDGVLELPAGAVMVDSVSWTDGGATDVVYGAQLTASGTIIGAATRFVGDMRANTSGAWYAGARVGAASDPTYSDTVRTANFPSGGALTPGSPNIGNAVTDAPVDLNGDGKTDYLVVRAAGGAGSQLTWPAAINGGNPRYSREWGVSGDEVLAGDYDGDGADDITVYRPSNGTFYIIQSATLTMRIEQLGQVGDDPSIVGDYNGDGRDDIAVYRSGAQATWFYKTSPTSFFEAVIWGESGDRPAPGDYDGDGKADFVVYREQNGNGFFLHQLSGGGFSTRQFGLAGDMIVPGDYDDDGKTDMAVVRSVGGNYEWHFEPSDTPGTTIVSDTWGVTGDVIVQGDYDGDGRTDYAVWRPGSPATFYVMTVSDRVIFSRPWGQTGDVPVAGYNSH